MTGSINGSRPNPQHQFTIARLLGAVAIIATSATVFRTMTNVGVLDAIAVVLPLMFAAFGYLFDELKDGYKLFVGVALSELVWMASFWPLMRW